MAQYRAVFADPDPPRSYEARVRRPDGSERVVEARADFLVRDGERVAMVSAIRDVTERKRLDQAQQDFVAMASHDLASPLTVLRARAQLLLRRRAYDEESLTAILEQTGRMDRLIADLRELAQVEGGGLALQREAVDLVALAEEAVERARTLATGHACAWRRRRRRSSCSATATGSGRSSTTSSATPSSTRPHGGEIVVRVEAADGEARLSVADRGPGIPADALPRLFERFYRGQHAAEEAGLGLGLYISRMLVEAHGGRIWAASELGAGQHLHRRAAAGRTTLAAAGRVAGSAARGKTPTSPVPKREPVDVCSAVRFRTCVRLRSACSERTPLVSWCHYPRSWS